MAELRGPLPPQALDHLAKGNKIAAIKVIRRGYGLSLKEGMDAVEDYIRSHRDLAARVLVANPSGGPNQVVSASASPC